MFLYAEISFDKTPHNIITPYVETKVIKEIKMLESKYVKETKYVKMLLSLSLKKGREDKDNVRITKNRCLH